MCRLTRRWPVSDRCCTVVTGLQEAGVRQEFLRHGGKARLPEMRRRRGGRRRLNQLFYIHCFCSLCYPADAKSTLSLSPNPHHPVNLPTHTMSSTLLNISIICNNCL